MDKYFLKVEIADTPSKTQKGLMFRKSLGEDNGMLFKFSRPQKLSFWGLNTYIPLDIAFVNSQGKIVNISHISPLSTKSVSSDRACTMAIEANYGYFQKNKISSGDTIQFDKLSKDIGKITFKK